MGGRKSKLATLRGIAKQIFRRKSTKLKDGKPEIECKPSPGSKSMGLTTQTLTPFKAAVKAPI
ncbi:unnamed protein product [Darwinula stevensoni]|uniref:Uncharacterized protein n=1 Tax=Darwinula stevensoni TaxID=69355 RepID=A0A7R9ABE9_9CRUS|nr:unnamed protein product [Darwinula stevensoni]CAG0899364.1 unnamed protein product [Darwinula stevensoni]